MTEPPLAEPHERWCGRTGVSHPLLPDSIITQAWKSGSYVFGCRVINIKGFAFGAFCIPASHKDSTASANQGHRETGTFLNYGSRLLRLKLYFLKCGPLRSVAVRRRARRPRRAGAGTTKCVQTRLSVPPAASRTARRVVVPYDSPMKLFYKALDLTA